ncbi:50S ribosomal protein L18 [Thermochromatium tepidum]|uniref:Large ribosomal subunit protein uL18 n=1 Tax=Thermochromatium tepidum ATCC 43061 TaxID=316276 RepID=A0A6I6E1H1_THETI|nr:50S ribosomal protein L18 [Thermochromatium tepidum]QGU32785.1 50S ribosomal protein L18 [Thermochromatium tepidum ATCC 43061]
MDKKQARLRRATRARAKMRELGVYRLCVHRTPRHTYAQIIAPGKGGDRVLASASTVEKALAAQITGNKANIAAAVVIGKAIAERALAVGVETVAFDRSGFRYHGRLKALADAAREGGLKF